MRQTARRFCSNPGCLFRAAVQSKLRSVSSSRSDRPLISRNVRVYNNVQSTSILLSSGAFESEQTERQDYYYGLANNNVNVISKSGARRRALRYSSTHVVPEDLITDNR